MSNEMKEFGGWRKKPGVEAWRPKDGHPYVVRTDEVPERCYKAILKDDEPELLDTVVVGDRSEKSALETAQSVCESHWRQQQGEGEPKAAKLGVATALDWAEGDDGVWTAPGPDGRTYICEEDNRDGARGQYGDLAWFAAVDEEELSGSEGVETLEAAQALCQQHYDSELVWREAQPGEIWVATSAVLSPHEDYGCVRDAVRGTDWTPELCGDPLGGPTTLELAKEACQEHHRAIVMGGADGRRDIKPEKPLLWHEDGNDLLSYGPDEHDDLAPLLYCCYGPKGSESGMWTAETADGLILGDTLSGPDGAKSMCQTHYDEQGRLEAAKEAIPDQPGQLPAPQRADWVIPVPLTEAEMVEAFESGRKLRRRKRQLQREVASSHERHKKLAARNKELIDKLEEEIEELDEQMPEKPVDCVRGYVRDGEEIWVQYTGCTLDVPAEAQEILHEHKLSQFEQRQLFGEGDPPADKPPEPAIQQTIDLDSDTPPEEQVAAAGEQAADKIAQTDPLPPERDLTEKLEWRPVNLNGERAYTTGCEIYPRYVVDKDEEGKRRVQFELADGVSRKLRGAPKRLKDAFELADRDNKRRTRWLGDPEATTQVDSRNRYQLQLMVLAGSPGSGRISNLWRAELIGSLGQPNEELTGSYVPLLEAQMVCDEHAVRVGQ